MPAYHLRTFYLARQPGWNDTNSLNFFRLEGVTEGSVTVTIEDKVLESLGWNVGHITMQQVRDSEITLSLVATYEQIIYIMHALFGAVAPTGGPAPFFWKYTIPANNAVTPQFYAIKYGIENTIYELTNCVLTEMTIKGEVKEALTLELAFVSPYAPVQSTLSFVSFSDLNIIHIRDAEFYLSDIDVFPYTTTLTPVEATLVSFEINVNPNRHIKRFIGNSSWYGDGKWQIDGTLTVEFNAISKQVIDESLSNVTKRNLRLNFISSKPNKIFSIIMPFMITDSFELFSDRDGNATVELKVAAIYTNVVNSSLQIDIVSDTDTLL